MIRVLARALLAIVCSSGLLASAAYAQKSDPIRLTFVGVTVIDTAGGPPQKDMTVVISGGRIERLEKSRAAKSGSDRQSGETIDARGKFIIPGLWDMHTHIAGINADPAWAKDVLIPLLIANGITGIRDMGGDLDVLRSWRKAIDNGTMIGPHIVAAGPMLLPASRQGAAAAPADPSIFRVGSPEEARAGVDSLKKRGADFIKVIQLPRDSYFAMAEESKKDGIPFVGHVPTRVTAVEASNAGQKSIEHIIYSSLAFDCSSKEEELRRKGLAGSEQEVADATDEADRTFSADKASALWQTFRRNGTWVTPTLFSIHANAHRLEDSPNDPQLAFLPAPLRKEWAPPATPTKDDRDTAAWWERQFENDRKLTGEMNRAGVRLLAGSDSLDRYVFVGTSLHEELKMLVEAGLTPLEALETATRNPAEFLGRKNEGAVVVGNAADLVLLDASPLENIANTKKIAGVMLAGRYFSRADLDGMAAKARAAASTVEPQTKHSQQ
jgi:imidazolonepropionase-like amidohydrolase